MERNVSLFGFDFVSATDVINAFKNPPTPPLFLEKGGTRFQKSGGTFPPFFKGGLGGILKHGRNDDQRRLFQRHYFYFVRLNLPFCF